MSVPRRSSRLRSVQLFAGTAVLRAGTLLLLPTALILLDAADVARFSLFASLPSLLTPLLSLGVHTAPQRLYFDSEEPDVQARLLGTCLLAALVLTLTGTSLLLLLAWWQNESIVSGGSGAVRIAAAGLVLATVVNEFVAWVLRVQGRSRSFLRLSLVSLVLMSGLSVSAPFLRGAPFESLSVGLAAVNIITACWGVSRIAESINLRVDRDLLVQAVRFSAPASAHAIALWFVSSSGRWIGATFVSLRELAGYGVASMVVNGLGALAGSLYHANAPEIGRAFAKGDVDAGRSVLEETRRTGVLVLGCAYLTVAIILPFVIGVWPALSYLASGSLLVAMFAASALHMWYLAEVNTLIALKRTELQAAATAVAGTLGALVTYLLARSNGNAGLTLALPGGFLLLVVASGLMRRRAMVGAR